MKNGTGNVSLKIFNRIMKISEYKHFPQNILFRCGRTHINSSLKYLGTTYGLQKEVLKKRMDHDEVFEDTWMNKKD